MAVPSPPRMTVNRKNLLKALRSPASRKSLRNNPRKNLRSKRALTRKLLNRREKRHDRRR
ncbi:hypothetical protein GCM10008094_17980 [Aidingimonas halophila]|nr:hypothetical protein GCM10008094_17980 [Aidingimonas halophila]